MRRSGKLRTILNDHWLSFYNKYKHNIREDIVSAVVKVLACGTSFLGFRLYQCGRCDMVGSVYHTCKSRFCTSCGRKQTENWILKYLDLLPKTTYQHITFTLPKELQEVIWLNRWLINALMPIPAQLLTAVAQSVGVTPGIFIALHTAGRDLKGNVHFHCVSTLSGLSPNSHKFIPYFRYNRRMLAKVKQRWRNHVLKILNTALDERCLNIPKNFNLNEFIPCTSFIDWIEKNKERPWVVHFARPSKSHRHLVEYLGAYLKKPAIGETRIQQYDGDNVTYEYFDHHENETVVITMPVLEFIKRLVRHIPDNYFRMVRYYNWLSTRTRNKWLPFIYEKLQQKIQQFHLFSWQDLSIKTFGIDPLVCPHCRKGRLLLVDTYYAYSAKELTKIHQHVALAKSA